MRQSELRFRQVHLDFHTSPLIPGVGAAFDPEQFAATLAKARVNSVTCFARCHHGMLYYDSQLFPERVHPQLGNKNLLKEEIDACHRRNIRVPIYLTVQWDDFTAHEHPEWLSLDANGAPVGEPFPVGTPVYEAGFYRALCVNSPYRDFLKAQTKEVLETFAPADGLFFDIVFVNECSCKHCLAGMEAEGYDPVKKENRLRYAVQVLDEFMLEMTEFVQRHNPDCSVFYNKSHVGPVHRPVLEAFSHFELESLPSGGVWGYQHFPVTIRYARNLGRDCLGMTGKFHTEWGDFHSFKNQAALEYECLRMLALNAKCMIGDQLEPHGRLSQPVYDLIGAVYSQVERKEPWCQGAQAITEIGVLTPEEFIAPGQNPLAPSILGVTRMLTEGARQFEIIDSRSDFARYPVLILPDEIPVHPELAAKLKRYLDGGGAVLASFESGLNEAKQDFALAEFGVRVRPELTRDVNGELVKGRNFPSFDYADYLLPRGRIGQGLPETEHVMYLKGLEVDALPESEILAEVILPYFNRTYRHFCSHRQTPSSGRVGYPGIVRKGRVIYFAHPIFTQYHQNAPRWCKRLFLNALAMLLPEPLLWYNGPSTLLATVNAQAAQNRWVVHLLHYIPERRCRDIDIIEDIIPLYDLQLSLKTTQKVRRVELAPEGTPLEFAIRDGRVEFRVPKVNGHQMLALLFD